jgi:hypothetical protein
MNHGESEAGGNCGVDCVAAFAQDLNTCIGGEMMNADHHAMFCADGLLTAPGEDGFVLLCEAVEGRDAGGKAGYQREKISPTDHHGQHT